MEHETEDEYYDRLWQEHQDGIGEGQTDWDFDTDNLVDGWDF